MREGLDNLHGCHGWQRATDGQEDLVLRCHGWQRATADWVRRVSNVLLGGRRLNKMEVHFKNAYTGEKESNY